MTVKEAAALYGVSTQAIYQRIAKAGKSVDILTHGKPRQLTEDGEGLLAQWFTNTQQVDCKHCQELEKEKAALQALCDSLQAQLKTTEEDKQRLYTLLAQAQQTTQTLVVARISGDGQEKRGLMGRIFGKKK